MIFEATLSGPMPPSSSRRPYFCPVGSSCGENIFYTWSYQSTSLATLVLLLGKHGLRESLIAKSGWNELDHKQWSHPNYSQNISSPCISVFLWLEICEISLKCRLEWVEMSLNRRKCQRICFAILFRPEMFQNKTTRSAKDRSPFAKAQSGINFKPRFEISFW